MATKLRKSPPVCLVISLLQLLTGQLRYSKQYAGKMIRMEDGGNFTIFRHITIKPDKKDQVETVFIVSFKFSKLSHKANKIASIIPMLLIAGFPGFTTKIYAVNYKNGYWQGMYQWKSIKHLNEYKKSFVFRVMNKRAIPDSLNSVQFENKSLDSYILEFPRY
jgi:hypothetical protein